MHTVFTFPFGYKFSQAVRLAPAHKGGDQYEDKGEGHGDDADDDAGVVLELVGQADQLAGDVAPRAHEHQAGLWGKFFSVPKPALMTFSVALN